MDSQFFPEAQIMKRLALDNPWWDGSGILREYEEMKPRLFLRPFLSLLESLPRGRSIIMLGARRVGKTVLIHHSISRLIENGIDPRKIIFLTVDGALLNLNGLHLEEMLELAAKASKTELSRETEGLYVFFDEIQYLENWESELKVLSDTYKGIRFVASGSAAAALKFKSMESGAGRFTHFCLPPLLFCEYLRMAGAEGLVVPTRVNWFGKLTDGFDTVNVEGLNSHFIKYLNYGGFPEAVVGGALTENPHRYVKEDMIDKVLLRDLPGLYGISDTRDLYRLFVNVVFRSGEEFSYEDLSRASGLRKEVLKKYLTYLESAFLIKIFHKVDESARKFQRVSTFKIYVTNPSVFAAVFSPVTPDDEAFNHLVEAAIYTQLSQSDKEDLYYANWRSGRRCGEVDFVRLDILGQKPERALEVKWSDKYSRNPGELKSLLAFMENNNLERAVVTSVTEARLARMDRISLQFVPTALYAYAAGIESVKTSD